MTVLGLNPSQVDTAATFKLGTSAEDHNGSVYIYVKASAAVAAFAACLLSEDGTIAEMTTTTAAGGTGGGKRVAVPQVALASGRWGWAAVYGGGSTLKVLAANATKFTQLNTTATPGVVDDAPTAAFILGMVLEVTVGAQAATFCTLNYPHVNITI